MKPSSRNLLPPARSIYLLAACLIFTLTIAGLTACGKKGNPKPPGTKNTFAWVYADASIGNECLSICGRLQGDYGNLESMRLEVEPMGEVNDCIGCPFNPLETEIFYASNLNMAENGEFTLLYCPQQKSHIYRWRLIAVNTYHTLPNALTPVLTVEDPAGPLPWN